jgi:16S rRNA (cytidine1402-2'-O)-methyltransferase
LPADGFAYLNKLPYDSKERRDLLASVAFERRTLVIQEKPADLSSTLADLHNALGSRPLCIVAASAIENNSVYRGPLHEAAADPPELPGDEPAMLVIGGHRQNDARWSEEELLTELQARLEAGQPAKEIARALAAESGWPRREIYSLAVDSGRSPA